MEEEKKGRSAKSKITTVLLCLALFCVFSILLIIILEKDDKKSDKPKDDNGLFVFYAYKFNEGMEPDLTTEKVDNYVRKYEYKCESKKCVLLNEYDENDRDNGRYMGYALIGDDKKLVIYDLNDEKTYKTGIEYQENDDKTVGKYSFNCLDNKCTRLDLNRMFNKELWLLRFENNERVYAYIYSLVDNEVVEGREYLIHDGMEYDFDDDYKQVYDSMYGDVTLNYDTLRSNLFNQADAGKKIILKNCTNCHEIDYENANEATCTEMELTRESIDKVIDKLKSAKGLKVLSTGKLCSMYTYHIGDYITVFESDDRKSLLVGLGDKDYGYAFDYDEEVLLFFEGLKN